MNINELLSKFQNLMIGVLVMLFLAYGTNNYIYKPKIKEVNSLKSSLKLIDSEIKTIPGGELLLKDLPAARSMVKNELDELSKKIPTDTQTPYLINNFISVVGKGLNIDYNLIQPGELAPERKYKRLPLRVEFDGNYADLNTYLAQLKKLPVTIRVDSMDLRKLSGAKKLGVKMSLSAFVMPGGAEKPPGKLKEQYTYYDPFYTQRARSGAAPSNAITGLEYSGYWLGKELKAIINDEIVGAGQRIRGFEVIRIYRDRIMLKKDNKSYELPFGGR